MEKESVKSFEAELITEKALDQICSTQSNKLISALPRLNGI